MIFRGSHYNQSGSVPPVFNPATILFNALGVNKTGDNVVSSGYDKIVELGETVDVSLSGSIILNDETSIDNRRVEVSLGARTDLTFSTNTLSLSDNGITDETNYQVKATADNNGNPTTITSVIRDVKFQLPVLYGNVDDLNQSPEDLYTALTVKMAVQNQDLNLTFPSHGNGYHKVIALPNSWDAITHIIKDGQWEQVGSFISLSKDITKTGGAWTETYTIYATNLMNAMSEANYEIQF